MVRHEHHPNFSAVKDYEYKENLRFQVLNAQGGAAICLRLPAPSNTIILFSQYIYNGDSLNGHNVP